MVHFGELDRKGMIPADASFQQYNYEIANIYYTGTQCFAAHRQAPIEILTMVSGDLRVFLEKKEYVLHTGDSIIINPYVLHEGHLLDEKSTCFYYCISIDLPFFAACLPEFEKGLAEKVSRGESGFIPYVPADKATEIMRASEELYVYQKSERNLWFSSATMRMLAILFESFYDYSFTPQKNTKFVKDICDYIAENYNKKISTASVSKMFQVSEGYFCRVFREAFPMTFIQYLTAYRVYASMALKGKGLTLEEIAHAVGYTDYVSFYRVFKSVTNMTVREYFK